MWSTKRCPFRSGLDVLKRRFYFVCDTCKTDVFSTQININDNEEEDDDDDDDDDDLNHYVVTSLKRGYKKQGINSCTIGSS